MKREDNISLACGLMSNKQKTAVPFVQYDEIKVFNDPTPYAEGGLLDATVVSTTFNNCNQVTKAQKACAGTPICCALAMIWSSLLPRTIVRVAIMTESSAEDINPRKLNASLKYL